MVAKVFKLDQCVLAPTLHYGLSSTNTSCNRGPFSCVSNTYRHEFINELVIGLASDPLMAQTNVVDVIEQFLPEKNSIQILDNIAEIWGGKYSCL